jgi:hypothetical protein
MLQVDPGSIDDGMPASNKRRERIFLAQPQQLRATFFENQF